MIVVTGDERFVVVCTACKRTKLAGDRIVPIIGNVWF